MKVKNIYLKGFLLIILAVLFLYPVVGTFGRSFYIDFKVSIQGYLDLLFDCFIFYPMFWNTVFYSAIITVIQLLVMIPCAFGLHCANFKGKSLLYLLYIVLMMMPLQVTILPNYIGLRDMNLVNTRWGIILPMIFSPFGVVVMYQYMKSLELSMIEAMRLETSSMIRVLLHAVIPQIKICIFAVILFVFAECWNMVEQPLLFLRDDGLKTMSVFISQTDKFSGAVLFPSSVVFMIPILLLYLLFQNSLEEGFQFRSILK